jgi:hypothetical protein
MLAASRPRLSQRFVAADLAAALLSAALAT